MSRDASLSMVGGCVLMGLFGFFSCGGKFRRLGFQERSLFSRLKGGGGGGGGLG